MKVLFLDIDGVLNTESSCNRAVNEMGLPSCGNWTYFNPVYSPLAWDPSCVAQLIRIVHETNCKIVISSSWRMDYEHVSNCLRSCQVASLETLANDPLIPIDKTGSLGNIRHSSYRGLEVSNWLEEHPEVTTYAIVDDNDDFNLDQKQNHFGWTNPSFGLTKEIADRLINILGPVNIQDTDKDNDNDIRHGIKD